MDQITQCYVVELTTTDRDTSPSVTLQFPSALWGVLVYSGFASVAHNFTVSIHSHRRCPQLQQAAVFQSENPLRTIPLQHQAAGEHGGTLGI